MPEYVFRNQGTIARIRCRMDEVDEWTAFLRTGGFYRVYYPTRVSIVPSYEEAMEESIEDRRQADKRVVDDYQEALGLIAEGLEEEMGHKEFQEWVHGSDK